MSHAADAESAERVSTQTSYDPGGCTADMWLQRCSLATPTTAKPQTSGARASFCTACSQVCSLYCSQCQHDLQASTGTGQQPQTGRNNLVSGPGSAFDMTAGPVPRVQDMTAKHQNINIWLNMAAATQATTPTRRLATMSCRPSSACTQCTLESCRQPSSGLPGCPLPASTS